MENERILHQHVLAEMWARFLCVRATYNWRSRSVKAHLLYLNLYFLLFQYFLVSANLRLELRDVGADYSLYSYCFHYFGNWPYLQFQQRGSPRDQRP